MLSKLGIAAVPHGFRSSFRDWAAEETDHPREVVEAALAHVVRNKVEAAYRRTDLFERRRRLMDDWAAYLPQMEMPNAMKVLTWNVNKAGESRRELWQMLKREDADIVLLQEVTGIPEWIRNRYQCHSISPRYFGGHNAPFSSAVLSKGSIDATL